LSREISKTGMEKMMKEKGKRLAAREGNTKKCNSGVHK
jgi:hypothetical protein